MLFVYNDLLSTIIELYLRFFSEITVALVILFELLFLSFQLKHTSTFESKRNLAIKNCYDLGLILLIITVGLVLVNLDKTFLLSNVVTEYFKPTFYTVVMQALILASGALILLNCIRFIKLNPKHHLMEYPFLFIFSLWFLLILVVSNNLLVTFISLVGFSLCLYVMIMMFSVGNIKNNLTWDNNMLGHEASIKYFYLSTFSSALILFSIILTYTLTQTLNFDELMSKFTLIFNLSIFSLTSQAWWNIYTTILLFLCIGFAFKLSAFPGHFWAPEVYEGSSNPTTAFIIIPVKIGSIAIFFRLLYSIGLYFPHAWSTVIWIISIGSLIFGALGAIAEKKFKKFLAYSSINQVGFLLLGVCSGRIEGLQSSIIFLLVYVVTNLVLFSIFFQLEERNTSAPITYISDLTRLRGYQWFNKLALTVVFFSFAGIPPFAGFFSKFFVLLEAYNNGYLGAVLIGIITTLISAYYYLRMVKLLWFDSSKDDKVFISKNIFLKSNYFVAVLLLFLISFMFFIDTIGVLTYNIASVI